MLNGPFFTALATGAVNPLVWFVVGVALISGVVRGFSGFGGALIFIPIASATLGPRIAVPMFYLIDLGSATPYGLTKLPRCNWREVLPMILGYWALLPAGAWLLLTLNPLVLRWATEAGVVAVLVLLISGWRFRGAPTPPLSFITGATAGFLGGSTGVSGAPVIAYWLGSRTDAAKLRDNIMAYYALSSSSTDVAYLLQGVFTWTTAAYSLLGWPAYAGGLWLGARLFRGTTDKGFRIAAYVLIATSIVLSLPLWDALKGR
ncbi:MAG TPA: sulfite exporter TauE/SafE family protein [Beijerinckiaceae bacterium]|nr:sulfite exporter TauE/SafE family protein [Beijerinckiaceae bacterium]